MLYTVALTLILHVDYIPVGIRQYNKFQVFSTVPIIDCTSWVEENPMTNERTVVSVCATEKIYQHMTGNSLHLLRSEGLYRI